MKISASLLVILILLLRGAKSHAQLTISGAYQGKNVYVQNPMNDHTDGYCTDSVTVNGDFYRGDIHASAYEIKLDSLGLIPGDSVLIHIFHQEECRPKVLNNTPFYTPVSAYIDEIELDPSGKLTWTAARSTGHIFIVQHYNWNRWVEVARLTAKNTDSLSVYSVDCSILHGENTFRVQQYHGQLFIDSKEVRIQSASRKVDCIFDKKTRSLKFSATTRFELYTSSGERVKLGEADSIDISDLAKGKYFLNYDVSSRKIRLR